MARGKLWSVKGVSPQAREAAKSAAQDADQPIGVWIDQAIRMSDEDRSHEQASAPQNQGEPSAEEIVRVLEALEARVANHADHIAQQLAPVRDSIALLSDRLERLEQTPAQTPPAHAASGPADSGPARPESEGGSDLDEQASEDSREAVEPTELPAQPERYVTAPVTTPKPTPPDTAPSPRSESTLTPDEPHFAYPEPGSDDVSDGPATDETSIDEHAPAEQAADEAEAEEPSDAPGPEVREEDIHAADAALKSELTGLFDDGEHRNTPFQPRGTEHDPFLPPPPPPPRQSSRAPLIFIVLILLVAGAGIGAFAWFQIVPSDTRSSFSIGALLDRVDPAAWLDRLQGGNAPGPTATEPATPKPEATSPPPPPPAPSPTTPSGPATTEAPPPASTRPTPPAPPVETPPASTTPPAPVTPPPAPESVGAAHTPPANPELTRLIQRASEGNASAQNDLGIRYLVGRGVVQDYEEAARWLRAAAAQDMTNAQYNLGVLYDSGRGVAQDPTQALFWFHSAAENGHGRAQMAMAAAYASGRGIDRNPEMARNWLEQAAESNIGEAQLSLANILATTPETHQSLVDALFWYKVADANGIAQAAERADQVSPRLTPDERAGVNARVSHFVSKNITSASSPPKRTTKPEPDAAPASTAPAPPSPPAPPPSTPAATQAQIQEIQRLLTRLGFDPGPADGALGQRTRDAIRNYQKELGLLVDGTPSKALLDHLRRLAGAG